MESASPLWFLVGLLSLFATGAWVRVATVLQREGVGGVHMRDAMRNAATITALSFGMIAIVTLAPLAAALLL